MKRFLISLFIFFCLISCSENYAPVNMAWSSKSEPKGGYIVQKGDTLYSIAWRYDMDYRNLAQVNHLVPPYSLEVGQVISLDISTLQFKPKKPQRVSNTSYHQVKTTSSPQVAKKSQNYPKVTTKSPIQTKTVSTVFDNKWIWPAKGKIVASYSPEKGDKGVNIAGKMGEPIYAAATGKVAYAGNGLRGYGNLVIIKHNDEFLSAYAHNQRILVQEGQNVKRGQMIATMGNTESKEVMLHFEIREAGKSVDPLMYVKP